MTTDHEITLSWSLHKWMHYPKMFLFLCYKRFTKTGIPETKPVTDQLQNWLSMACRRCGSELQRLVPRPHLTWLQVAWLRGTALEHHSPLWSFIATLNAKHLCSFAIQFGKFGMTIQEADAIHIQCGTSRPAAQLGWSSTPSSSRLSADLDHVYAFQMTLLCQATCYVQATIVGEVAGPSAEKHVRMKTKSD